MKILRPKTPRQLGEFALTIQTGKWETTRPEYVSAVLSNSATLGSELIVERGIGRTSDPEDTPIGSKTTTIKLLWNEILGQQVDPYIEASEFTPVHIGNPSRLYIPNGGGQDSNHMQLDEIFAVLQEAQDKIGRVA